MTFNEYRTQTTEWDLIVRGRVADGGLKGQLVEGFYAPFGGMRTARIIRPGGDCDVAMETMQRLVCRRKGVSYWLEARYRCKEFVFQVVQKDMNTYARWGVVGGLIPLHKCLQDLNGPVEEVVSED